MDFAQTLLDRAVVAIFALVVLVLRSSFIYHLWLDFQAIVKVMIREEGHGADTLTKIKISCSDIISYWVGSSSFEQIWYSAEEVSPGHLSAPELRHNIWQDRKFAPLVRLVSFISAHSSICRERRLGESWKTLIKSRPPVECVGLGVIKNSTQGEFYSFDTRRLWGEQHWGCKSASLTGPVKGKGHAMQKAHFLKFWDKCVILRYCLHIFLPTPRIEWAILAESLCEEKEEEERLESPICLEQEQRKGGFLLYSLYY